MKPNQVCLRSRPSAAHAASQRIRQFVEKLARNAAIASAERSPAPWAAVLAVCASRPEAVAPEPLGRGAVTGLGPPFSISVASRSSDRAARSRRSRKSMMILGRPLPGGPRWPFGHTRPLAVSEFIGRCALRFPHPGLTRFQAKPTRARVGESIRLMPSEPSMASEPQ